MRGVRLHGGRGEDGTRGVTSKRRRQRAGARTSLRTPRLEAAGQDGKDQHRRDLELRSFAVGEYAGVDPFLKVTGLKGAGSGAWGRDQASSERPAVRGRPPYAAPASGYTIAASWGCPAVPPPRPQWNSPRSSRRCSAASLVPLRGAGLRPRFPALAVRPRDGLLSLPKS